MALILCLETATTNCSVGIAKDGELLILKEDNSKNYSHAEKLHVFIKEAMLKAGVTANELDAVAVSKGPGSYTGLRIGVSSAKGLCYSLGIPLISVPTLDLLAYKLKGEKGLIVSMLDARRMEVYSAVYDSDINQLRDTEAQILEPSSFNIYLEKSKVHFIGNGVAKFEDICTHQNAVFHKEQYPSAKEMAAIAEYKYQKSDIEDVAYFEPYYLKDFIAG
ncbi:tRNA (adenosine(37)-N6)-threonylcarbamoyltransferase complex dimerization subunit type 1 TsaB [Christiangramia sabulilitoris]|uniref:tRNA (Adenosine(37)-N6)-threonylcarbamoyltransferase complex dimerization subunit type 1 TsaB n=1 Tax=Christiangramia sabulilitoris TaxID=2583991 RepID=A0A550HZR0_9FLAO|nr:tRNA (adenosine(37)-N6)-threonylcarbamoyltransferase complex dimerization subunit type 1 TsaB [Christiangramia sabulilitoris]TRO64213.1 tRNA (adenosine(37)-N6)-threonylcarbamoyltransferase complex dimerization subunit type 1 TsaB [Christiangramia sabulilitoris]